MIYVNGLDFGDGREEMLRMDQNFYPYVCYYREMDMKFSSSVPWHWHRAVEINYVAEGGMILITSEKEVILQKGDLCLINPGSLHCFSALEQQGGCKFYTHLFDVTFLSGKQNSLIHQKYFMPIIGNPSISSCVFSCQQDENKKMTEYFLKAVELDKTECMGHEYLIREILLHLWFLFFEKIASQCELTVPVSTADAKRIKIMLQYIHEHYQTPLSLEMIAQSAFVSKQECMRCFRKYINQSPISYLTEYRIRTAAYQLLNTDINISSISETCGFSSVGYFSKVFKKAMKCTPTTYRENATKELFDSGIKK